MIRTYTSKALEAFATEGDGSKLPVQNHARVRRILFALEAATKPADMHLPGYRFHGLSTKPKRSAVDATANYRVTWAWDDGDATAVATADYTPEARRAGHERLRTRRPRRPPHHSPTTTNP